MRYYKNTADGYLLSIGIGLGGTEITEKDYNAILAVSTQKPATTETTDYMLLENLTWKPYTIDPVSESEPTTEDKAEAYDILMGV